MKRKILPICLALSLVLTFAILANGVVAQEPEYDEFIYLPWITKPESPPPDCNAYEPNDTPSQANWIQDGETQIQCIMPATDQDWVKFSVSAEAEVILEAADEGGDLWLTLFDGDLNLIEYTYSGTENPARIDRECGIWGDSLAVGTYYARVYTFIGPEVPRYEITLSVTACPTPVVLSNHSHYATSYALYVVGEVQNNGEIGISWVDVIANLFNGHNQLIDTDTDSIWRNVLSGDKTCFELSFSEWAGWAYYEFETPTYYSTSDERLENMTVHGDYGTYDPIDGSYSILGFVRNDNDFRVESVGVIATLYDASGTVVGCGSTSVSSTDLDPGQSSSFEIRFSGYYRDYADVASYRIQVSGSSTQ